METEDTTSRERPSHDFARPLPEYVDWVAAVLIALGGLGLAVGGSALTFVVNRGLLEEGVETGQVTVVGLEGELTDAEALVVAERIVDWTGIGLVVTGIALVAFAVGYVVVRHRAHGRAGPDQPPESSRAYAVAGAVATGVLSFIPFSPVLGGGIAGYLEHYDGGRSVRVGALAGFLAMVPAVSTLAFVAVGLFAGLSAVPAAGLEVVVFLAMLLAVLFVAAYGTGLGALGGYVGRRLGDSDRQSGV